MKFLFIRFFFEANPTPGGGGTPPNPAPQPNPNPQPAPDPKPDAALQAKLEALEKEIAELKKGKTPEPNPQPQPKADEVPAWAKTQNELIEKLLNQVTTLQGEKVVTTRRTVLETELKAIEGLSQEHIEEVVDNFNGRTFKDDAEFETFKKGKVEKAKTMAQKTSADSLNIFSVPQQSAGDSGNKVSSAMAEYLKSKTPAASKN